MATSKELCLVICWKIDIYMHHSNFSIDSWMQLKSFWANQLIYANLDDQNVGTIHIKGNYARLFEYCVLLLMWFWFKKFKPIQNKKNGIVDSFVLVSALYSITLGHLVLWPYTTKISFRIFIFIRISKRIVGEIQ